MFNSVWPELFSELSRRRLSVCRVWLEKPDPRNGYNILNVEFFINKSDTVDNMVSLLPHAQRRWEEAGTGLWQVFINGERIPIKDNGFRSVKITPGFHSGNKYIVWSFYSLFRDKNLKRDWRDPEEVVLQSLDKETDNLAERQEVRFQKQKTG